MPCQDGGPIRHRDVASDRRLNLLTRTVCSVLKKIEEENGDIDAFINRITSKKDQAAVRLWWENHKKCDRQRLARNKKRKATEALRKSGLEKLSPKERRALGHK